MNNNLRIAMNMAYVIAGEEGRGNCGHEIRQCVVEIDNLVGEYKWRNGKYVLCWPLEIIAITGARESRQQI